MGLTAFNRARREQQAGNPPAQRAGNPPAQQPAKQDQVAAQRPARKKE